MKVDIQRVKAFNEELKRCNDKASTNAAEIEFNNREIKRLCDELTAELGISVTPENVAQIYEDRVTKTENTLKAGEAILERIKEEEAAEANTYNQAAQQPVVQPMTQQVDQQQYQQPVQQVAQQQYQQPAQQVAQQQYQQQYQQPVQQVVQQQAVQQVAQQQAMQIDQFADAPQMKPADSNFPSMGMFPSFAVGNRQPQQSTQAQTANDTIFGNGTIEI